MRATAILSCVVLLVACGGSETPPADTVAALLPGRLRGGHRAGLDLGDRSAERLTAFQLVLDDGACRLGGMPLAGQLAEPVLEML